MPQWKHQVYAGKRNALLNSEPFICILFDLIGLTTGLCIKPGVQLGCILIALCSSPNSAACRQTETKGVPRAGPPLSTPRQLLLLPRARWKQDRDRSPCPAPFMNPFKIFLGRPSGPRLSNRLFPPALRHVTRPPAAITAGGAAGGHGAVIGGRLQPLPGCAPRQGGATHCGEMSKRTSRSSHSTSSTALMAAAACRSPSGEAAQRRGSRGGASRSRSARNG